MVEIPNLQTLDAVMEFDRATFRKNPGLKFFLRRWLPCETPPELYLRALVEGQPFVIVRKVSPRCRSRALISLSSYPVLSAEDAHLIATAKDHMSKMDWTLAAVIDERPYDAFDAF